MSFALRSTGVVARRVALAPRASAALPVARSQSRQMSSAHGPPDPWPHTADERNRLYGYGLTLIAASAAIHLSIRFGGSSEPEEKKAAH